MTETDAERQERHRIAAQEAAYDVLCDGHDRVTRVYVSMGRLVAALRQDQPPDRLEKMAESAAQLLRTLVTAPPDDPARTAAEVATLGDKVLQDLAPFRGMLKGHIFCRLLDHFANEQHLTDIVRATTDHKDAEKIVRDQLRELRRQITVKQRMRRFKE